MSTEEKEVEIDIETGELVNSTEQEDQVEDDSEVGSERVSETSAEDSQDHDADDDDAGPGFSEDDTDEEREQIRARRRAERKNRREAQKEREATLRRELAARDSIINDLRARVDVVEKRSHGSDLAKIAAEKQQLANAYNYFKEQIKLATESQNGTVVAEATEKLIQSQRRFEELSRIEQAVAQRQSRPQPLDARLISNAQEWMNSNKWYDASAKDQDSRMVMTIDQQLAEEGWDPTTKAYWQELDVRVKKYLPHRSNGGIIKERAKPRSVVSGSSKESVSASKSSEKGTYRLSAERVKAMREAGVWDDPKQRAEAIKRFREYDQQQQRKG